MYRYSIITSAKNEEKFISKTLQSVTSQTILPVEWIIMNDDSSDKTGEIIEKFARKYTWIKKIDLHNFKPEIESIGGRVGHILNIAFKELRNEIGFITKLDADTEFDSTFFESLLDEFIKDPKLGIASGNLVFEGKREVINSNNSDTRGAVMIIRKEAFTQVGGFFESRGRGEDTLFSVAVRYFGWNTKTFPTLFNHLKPETSQNHSISQAFLTGFYKGSIPFRFDYFVLTLIGCLTRKPYIIGSLVQLSGYVNTRYISKYRPFPKYVQKQLQKEQKLKLISILISKYHKNLHY